MPELDLRGFGCPIPVVKTKKAMDEKPGEPISILLESAAAREKVTLLAESRNYRVESERADAGGFVSCSPPRESDKLSNLNRPET